MDKKLLKLFEEAGQGHVFAHWNTLKLNQQNELLNQAKRIDVSALSNILKASALRSQSVEPETIEPCKKENILLCTMPEWQKEVFFQQGEEAIRQGLVAAFTVAGGQATRLGWAMPKGFLEVTPLKKKTLFELFAQKIKKIEDSYQSKIPWFIMTSASNHNKTKSFFEKNNFFGLERVHFFRQDCMPAVDKDKKIIMESPFCIALSPNGHGGALKGFVDSKSIELLKKYGCQYVSYFQVDNPLAMCIDPLFIGLHIAKKSEFSSKVIAKQDPAEKVGVFCSQNGTMKVAEYTELSEKDAQAKDMDGNLLYKWANTAMHILSVDFISKVGGQNHKHSLPYRLVSKKIPAYDEVLKTTVVPLEPNGIKLECFIFDALQWAKNPALLEVKREDEFSPIKNFEGTDTLETAIIDQNKLFAKWLEAAGETLPKNEIGAPLFDLEISPSFAYTQDEFIKNWKELPKKPAIGPEFYL